MSRRTVHGVPLAIFVLLLAIPVIMKSGLWPRNEKMVARFGFALEEVAGKSGIDFVHRGPAFDAKLAHIMPHVAAMGAAVSAADFDRDGWQDLYLTNSAEGAANRLYRNLGNGKFEDVAGRVGVADLNPAGTGISVGAVWGDYNNDGFEDLFVYKWGRPELFRNESGQRFTRVSEDAGLPGWINAGSAVWLDYDCDGRLDLFVAGYWPDGLDLWHLQSTRMMPESFEYAENGGRKYLFRNLGDGRFEDVAQRLGIRSRRWTLAVAAADLNRSGYPDIFLANDYGVSELYRNDDGTGFEEIGRRAGVGYQPKSGMNAVFGDVLNQGRLAIYETNISEAGILLQGNNLWVARQDGELAFENLAQVMGVELGDWSFGAQFGDLNNDGRLDLFLTNGYVSASESESYWYDFSQVAGGHRAIISDAKHWPAMKGRSLAGFQQSRVWVNDGMGRFVDVAREAGVHDRFDGRAVALVDLWNRGVLDVVVANQRGPLLVYRNTVDPARQWIGFDLAGVTSNRSAIGAQVRVFWNGQEQMQEVSGGSGFSSQNQRRLHFGLGVGPELEKVVLTWPSGRSLTMENPALNVYHRVEEP